MRLVLLMRSISMIFHPLLLVSYVLLLMYFYLPSVFSPVSTQSIPSLILATFITTCIVPVLSVSIMKMSSRITSFELTNRQERILPFISIVIFYGGAAYLFITKLSINPPISTMLIGVTSLILILLVITMRFKISIHAAAIWGVCGFLVGLSLKITGSQLLIPMLLAFVFAGLVSSSRLYLNYHSAKEIWSGTLLGFIFCLGIMYWFG